jgi:V8-like Glu-specific endopeptidase
MSKARDSVIELECGYKLGGNKGGPYYYDYLCEKHVKEVQTNGKYDYDKAVKLTDELNRKVRKGELKLEVNT